MKIYKLISDTELLIDLSEDNSYKNVFKTVCINGHLDVAKWLLQLYPNIIRESVLNTSVYSFFGDVCQNGHLEMAKWLHDNYEYFDVDVYRSAFCYACRYGHLDVAKWLVGVKPFLTKHIHKEQLFISVCKTGQLDVAKWVFTLFPLINKISVLSDAFVKAGLGNHIHVMLWLLELNPKINMCADYGYMFHYICHKNYIDILNQYPKRRKD
jgi:hypothetical protein